MREVPRRARAAGARRPGRSSRAGPCGPPAACRGCRASNRRAGTCSAWPPSAMTSGSTSAPQGLRPRPAPWTAPAPRTAAHPSRGDLGHRVRPAAGPLGLQPRRVEARVPRPHGDAAARCPPRRPRTPRTPSARWSRSWRWCSSGDGVVALRERGARRRRAAGARRPSRCGRARRQRPTTAWSIAGRHGVEQPGGPHLHRSAADVPEAPHGPVVVDVELLEHERLAVDHDALEHRARLPVGAAEWLAGGGAGHQLLDRPRRLPRDERARRQRARRSGRDGASTQSAPATVPDRGHRRRGHRGRAGRHRHRRASITQYTQLRRVGPAVGRAVPVPRREDAVVQREPGARASTAAGAARCGATPSPSSGRSSTSTSWPPSSCWPAGPGITLRYSDQGEGETPQAPGRARARPWSRRSTGTTSGCCRRPTPRPPAATSASRGLDGDEVRAFRIGLGARRLGRAWSRRCELPDDVVARHRPRVPQPQRPTDRRLPGPDPVPDLRRQRRRRRLRRPGHAGRRGPEVQEHPGDRAVPEVQAPLRPQLVEGPHRHRRPRHRVRGLHRRDRLRPRRACPRRSPRAAPRSPRSTCGCCAATPARSCSPSTPTPPARPRPSASTSGSRTTSSRWPSPTCPPGVDPADLAGTDPERAGRGGRGRRAVPQVPRRPGAGRRRPRHRRGPGQGRRGRARRDPRAPERARARPVPDGGGRPLPRRARAAARRCCRDRPAHAGATTASTGRDRRRAARAARPHAVERARRPRARGAPPRRARLGVGRALDPLRGALRGATSTPLAFRALMAHPTVPEAIEAADPGVADLLARLAAEEVDSEPFDAVVRLLTERARHEVTGARRRGSAAEPRPRSESSSGSRSASTELRTRTPRLRPPSSW